MGIEGIGSSYSNYNIPNDSDRSSLLKKTSEDLQKNYDEMNSLQQQLRETILNSPSDDAKIDELQEKMNSVHAQIENLLSQNR